MFNQQQQQQQMGYNQQAPPVQGYSPQSTVMSPAGVVPISALTTLGVAAEAVGQISELKNYLSRQVRTSDKSETVIDCIVLMDIVGVSW